MKFSMFCLSLVCLVFTACGDSSSGGGSGSSADSIHDANGEVSEWQSSLVGQEGHGGDAVVCFSIPVERALYKVDVSEQKKNCVPNGPCEHSSSPTVPANPGTSSGIVWRMTDAGRKSIQSAKPLEQYLAEKIASKKALIDELNSMSLEEGYQRILRPLVNLPAPFKRISEMHKQLGWLHEDGIASEYGLADINDSGFLGEDEIDRTHCKELQAVVRRDQQLWYDADIVKNFDHAGKVLIQLHEEIYTWGKAQDEINWEVGLIPSHQDSTKSRRLILKLVDGDMDSKMVNENLKSLGFSIKHTEKTFNVPTPVGYFMDTEACLQEQQYLKTFFKNGGAGTDFWLAVENLFSKRYLKTSDSWPTLELRHNFPDALSNMISLTMKADAAGDQFDSEILRLQEIFERPESCVGQF